MSTCTQQQNLKDRKKFNIKNAQTLHSILEHNSMDKIVQNHIKMLIFYDRIHVNKNSKIVSTEK